jgi:DNA-binding CsgD family transcriptional regulator
VNVTDRQRELLDLKCRAGMTDLQSAHRLGVALQTVKNTLALVRRKNNFTNTTQMCAYFLRGGKG